MRSQRVSAAVCVFCVISLGCAQKTNKLGGMAATAGIGGNTQVSGVMGPIGSSGAGGTSTRTSTAGASAVPLTASSGGVGGSTPMLGVGGNAGGGGGGGLGATAGMGGAGAGGVGGGTAGSSAVACTGKPGMKRGKSNQTLMAGGAQRTFILYAPMKLDANKPAPIVVVPHGFSMSGQDMFDITTYDKIADREGFVAVFPDGEGSAPWNVGSGICGVGAAVAASGDDQSFMDAIVKFVEDDQCVDHDHIYITGFSMGGYFSNETGCMNTHFRAIGPHSGGTHDLSACAAKHKPAIIFHFKSDSLIDYSCGTGARDEWVKHNGCTPTAPDVTMVKGGSCEYYKGCPADGQVALCSFDEPAGGGGELVTGHAWSGGSTATGNGFVIGSTESAAELGWAFFKKYAW